MNEASVPLKRLLFSALLRLASIEVSILLGARRFVSSLSSGSLRKTVVVLANDGMGDNLYRIPLFAALRRRYPASEWKMVAFVLPQSAGMFRRMPYFDEIRTAKLYSHSLLVWPFSGYVAWTFSHRVDIWINLVRIRTAGYDFACRLACPGWSAAYDTSLLSLHLPDEAAFQRRRYDRLYSLLLSSMVSKNLFDDYRSILSGLPNATVPATLSREDVSYLLDSSYAVRSPTPRYCVFVPGAADVRRRWPIDRFRAVAAHLLDGDCALSIVVVGTASESQLGESIQQVRPDRIANLCGRTSLARLGTILAGARFVLSNETGTAHYAAVLGVRTICILGGGDFNSYFPMSAERKNVACVFKREPCYQCAWFCIKGGDAVPFPCIDSVSVSDVLSFLPPCETLAQDGR